AQIQKLINSRCFDSITLTLRDNSNKKSEASLPIAPYESNTNGTNTQPWLSGSVPYFSLPFLTILRCSFLHCCCCCNITRRSRVDYAHINHIFAKTTNYYCIWPNSMVIIIHHLFISSTSYR